MHIALGNDERISSQTGKITWELLNISQNSLANNSLYMKIITCLQLIFLYFKLNFN